MKKTYALCSSRARNEDLAERLAESTGMDFILVTDEGQLDLRYLREKKVEAIFVVHWSSIIKREIYESIECIIFHMTDLPYGRGGSPLQNLILRGQKKTKISALRCVKEVDAGPIYLKRELDLDGSAEEIFTRAKHVIEEMIVEMVQSWPTPVAQQGEIVNFKRRTPSQSSVMSFLASHGDDVALEKMYDFLRMLDADGYPHAFFETTSFKFEFTNAKILGNEVFADVRITKKD